MKKIKLSESQIKMIQEHEKSLGKKKVLKITEDHYNTLFSSINESNEVNVDLKKYKPQSEKENKKTHQSFNESISEDVVNEAGLALFDLFLPAIKQFYSDPSQNGLSPFWLKLGITWGDLKIILTGYGIMISTVVAGKEIYDFATGDAIKNGVAKLGTDIKKMMKAGVQDIGKRLYNMIADKKRYDMDNGGAVIQDEGVDPSSWGYEEGNPSNYDDEEGEMETQNETPFDLIVYNDTIAILKKYREASFFILNIDGQQIDGDSDLYSMMNDMYDEGVLIDYMEPLTMDTIVNIENSVQLNSYFRGRLDKIKSILMNNTGVEENTTTGSVGGSYVTPKIWAKSKKDMRFGKKPMYKKGTIVDTPLTEEEPMDSDESPKRGPKALNDADRKIEVIIKAIYKAYPELKNHKLNLRYVIGTALSGLALGITEGIQERTGQVSFDDCVELNNNKEAQNGGCSTGAIDNVVKVDETIVEAVAKQTGKSISEVRDIIIKHKTKK